MKFLRSILSNFRIHLEILKVKATLNILTKFDLASLSLDMVRGTKAPSIGAAVQIVINEKL